MGKWVRLRRVFVVLMLCIPEVVEIHTLGVLSVVGSASFEDEGSHEHTHSYEIH